MSHEDILWKAASNLERDVRGMLRAFESEMREAVGHTNYRVMKDHAERLREVLDGTNDRGPRRDLTQEIIDKCEQYFNAHNICDEEVHAILEFIHSRAIDSRATTAPEIAKASGMWRRPLGEKKRHYYYRDLAETSVLYRSLCRQTCTTLPYSDLDLKGGEECGDCMTAVAPAEPAEGTPR
jgi:hypothetical protein